MKQKIHGNSNCYFPTTVTKIVNKNIKKFGYKYLKKRNTYKFQSHSSSIHHRILICDFWICLWKNKESGSWLSFLLWYLKSDVILGKRIYKKQKYCNGQFTTTMVAALNKQQAKYWEQNTRKSHGKIFLTKQV